MILKKSAEGRSRQWQDKLTASVIICAYTEARWKQLLDAVTSVKAQTMRDLQIIVVVDHNPTLAKKFRRSVPDVTVLENTSVRGLSAARNCGLQAVTGSIVAFLDDDAYANPDWLETLTSMYVDHQVMGVGGAIHAVWPEHRPSWFPLEFDWVVGCTYTGMPATLEPIRNLIGCNMSFRREIFDSLGGFDVGMGRIGTRPVGCEETELCIRASQRYPEKQLWYEPRAQVHHQVHLQRTSWKYFLTRCYSEGISKARVSQLVGVEDGLSAEWRYTFRTLPLGFVRALGDVLPGDFSGLSRASAIVAGLLFTTTGYLVGKITEWQPMSTAIPLPSLA